jgi:hypothetical protein
MRLSFLILLVFAALPGLARAELRLPRDRADLGDMRGGPTVKQRFAFVNGSRPVDIVEAKASCGCLKPQLSKQHFAPGEEGWVEVEINTLSQPAGPNAWRVDLKYRDGDQPAEAAVIITATLTTEITVQPGHLNIFTDQAITHEIALTDLRAKPLTVTAVRASSPHLKTLLQEPCRDLEGHAMRIVKLEVAGDYPDGCREEVVTLYTDDPAYPELKVTATITKRARQRLSAAPAEVTLSAAPGQPLPSRIVLLRDVQDQAVVVEQITCDDPVLTCRWAKGPNTMATLRIQVDDAKLGSRQLRSAVHIHVVQPLEQTITIPVSVYH